MENIPTQVPQSSHAVASDIDIAAGSHQTGFLPPRDPRSPLVDNNLATTPSGRCVELDCPTTLHAFQDVVPVEQELGWRTGLEPDVGLCANHMLTNDSLGL